MAHGIPSQGKVSISVDEYSSNPTQAFTHYNINQSRFQPPHVHMLLWIVQDLCSLSGFTECFSMASAASENHAKHMYSHATLGGSGTSLHIPYSHVGSTNCTRTGHVFRNSWALVNTGISPKMSLCVIFDTCVKGDGLPSLTHAVCCH
uniref:Uncharacterized protein n=1 Tax=Micrurus surinamensis TaxID=129470 RepID=A0A2D4P4H7_MICSU